MRYKKNGQVFPSKICDFQYDHRLLLSKEMGNITSCKKVKNLCCQESISFGIFKVA